MAEPYMGEGPGEMRAAGHNGQVPGGGAEEANDGRSDTSTPAIRAALVNGEECEASTDAPREDQARPSEPDVAPHVVS